MFLSLSQCEIIDNTLYHEVFTEIQCFQSIHILHVSLSYVMLLIFTVITIFLICMHFENRFSKDPASR